MTANPIAETVASLMPRARAELAELVAFAFGASGCASLG